MEAKAENNKDDFPSEHLYGKKSIVIKVAYKYIDDVSLKEYELENIERHQNNVEKNSDGYSFYSDGENDIFFQGTVQNPTQYVSCANNNAAQKHKLTEILCQRQASIGNDVIVYMIYSKEYLPLTKEIDAKVVHLLNDFRVLGPEFAIIE